MISIALLVMSAASFRWVGILATLTVPVSTLYTRTVVENAPLPRLATTL